MAILRCAPNWRATRRGRQKAASLYRKPQPPKEHCGVSIYWGFGPAERASALLNTHWAQPMTPVGLQSSWLTSRWKQFIMFLIYWR